MIELQVWPGARVTFEAGNLRNGEAPVLLEGIVESVAAEHVWLSVSAGRMCIARRALRSVAIDEQRTEVGQ